jgi:hypothetical protein
VLGEGHSSIQKSNDPLDLDSSEAEKSTVNQSWSPPPSLEEAERSVGKTTSGDAALC